MFHRADRFFKGKFMKKFLAILFFLCVFLSFASLALEQGLTWESSKEAVISKAKSEKKLILLVVSTLEDPNTVEFKDTICESEEPPIKNRIQDMYVPWYLDLMNPELEHVIYTGGMSGFQIPVICLIHPDYPDENLDKRMGVPTPEDFLEWLNTYNYVRDSEKAAEKY